MTIFDQKLEHSIQLLRKSESLALRYSDDGFFLAFSGGKDSQALYHVAKMAGVKFKAHYQLTTLDPPEVVRFIRSHYPDCSIERPRMTFSQLCIHKKLLPTRVMRFCCAELKETKGAGTVTLTGVRRAESARRAQHKEVIRRSNNKQRNVGGDGETMLDQFNREREIEGVQCIKGKDKIVINPIIEWSDKDVWHFLNNVAKVEHCSLYDEGWHRLGCLFCPISNKKTIIMEMHRYPKYYDMMLRTIARIRAAGGLAEAEGFTDAEVFDWWVSKISFEKWKANKTRQLTIDYDDV